MTYKWDAAKAKQAAKDRNHSDYEDGFMICPIHGKQPNVSGNVGCEECEACLLEQKAANQTDPDYLKFLEDQDTMSESEIEDTVYSAPDCIRTGDPRMTEDELNQECKGTCSGSEYF